MSTQDQARALMVRHQHMVKNREQCLLSRAAAEVGMPAELNLRDEDLGKAHLDRASHRFS
ncbi:hypothetical protein AB3R30_16555 [Leptolyngbyaceae cyanobacterium UHCC 1019]